MPFDQVIKMTISRFRKDVGELSRNTQNPGTIERWTKIRDHIFVIPKHIKKKTKRKTKQKHVELGTARIKQNKEDVRNIMTCINVWLSELSKKCHLS